jgi:hypothetical protein
VRVAAPADVTLAAARDMDLQAFVRCAWDFQRTRADPRCDSRHAVAATRTAGRGPVARLGRACRSAGT